MTRPNVPLPWLEHAVLGLALVGLALVARGGPGWGITSGHAIGAVQLERAAGAPLYDVLASVAAWIPLGEPGFRLAALDAVLAASVLVGVVAATRALVAKLPAAGAIGALLLALSPPLREASGPGLLAACGAVWAVAGALRATRDHDQRDVLAAFGGCAVAIGGEPWLGALLAMVIGAWLVRGGARPGVVAIAVAALGVLVAVWWLDALGSIGGLAPGLGAALAATGRGAGAIVVGAGLLGAAFAAVTGLPGARGLLAIIGVTGLHAALVAGDARGTPMLAVLAIGAALIPVAIVRAAAPAATGLRALGVTAAAGVPLVVVAVVAGIPSLALDGGDGPTRVAHGLLDALPAGPGVVITTRPTSWFALEYARVIAGARPDLAIAPPMPPEAADVVAVQAMRMRRIAGGDVPAVGRLDMQLAQPRGRAFQLLLAAPSTRPDIASPPARYGDDAAGTREAIAEALERARYEASNGRLDQAARAAGLATRFGAADLAVLAATVPTAARPALYDFVPSLGTPAGAWMLDLFGDDLAWVAGSAAVALPVDAPAPRKLHALWCLVISKQATADDPRIVALGPAAVSATAAMMKETGAGSGSGSGSGG